MSTGKRGRPKKPSELKILEGNRGKRKIEKNEVKPKPDLPRPPKFLMKAAKREWKRIAPKLYDLGLLSDIDEATLAGYCQAYARWQEAEIYLNSNNHTFKTENGYQQQVPQINIANNYAKLMLSFLTKFGLSPSDRSNLVAPEKLEKNKSKMNALLSK